MHVLAMQPKHSVTGNTMDMQSSARVHESPVV